MRPVLFLPRRGWLLAGAIVAAACRSGPPTRLQDRLDLIQAAAERDSLFQELAATSRAIAEISTQLASVEHPAKGTPESPDLHTTLNDRDYLLTRVQAVTARLKEAESRLAVSERRARRLASQRDSLNSGLTLAQSVIADLQHTVEVQRASLAGLEEHLANLNTVNGILADSTRGLASQVNTAYFVIGSRDELIARGVLVAEGPRSIPLVGRRAVAPARELPLREFTSIDRSVINDIPLPDSSRTYRIVSRQNLNHLAGEHSRGRVRGSIRIASAEGFWEPSRYLIVVAQ